MRIIKSITVVCAQGVKRYEVGDKVNGLEIARILDNSIEDNGSIHIGFTCKDRGVGNGSTVVEIWNAPVVVEYAEGVA